MQLPLRRALSASVRRGLSTAAAASHPPWAMIDGMSLVNSRAPRAFLELAEPPRASNLLVPLHLINPLPRPEPITENWGDLGGMVRGTSGDGLLLLQFHDEPPAGARRRAAPDGELVVLDTNPDITRFVCNPLSGELVRLPDIDGTKKCPDWHPQGLLTRRVRGHGPPDRFAVAELSVDGAGDGRSFAMRRFFSETGEWDKLVGLPSPLPLPREISIDHEVLPFAGRLWWVDLTWGAVSADPFSDRPELSFVELPKASVCPVRGPGPKEITAQGLYRRMGVSEGRMRYVEVSQKEPFVLSSFALDDDCSGWTLEHQVALSRILADAGKQEGTPRIGVIHPLNASFMSVINGHQSLTVDMDNRKVLQCSPIHEDEIGFPALFSMYSAFLKPCVLPPWLGSSRIPSAGTLSSKASVKSRTLSDILVRVDRDKKN
ncbi:hypothetical protein ACP4OV_028903 [Aristida adscensionis]